MKTIILGDIHGRTIWKDIIAKEGDFDKIVFIGDYLDTHENINGEQQLSNLLDIIEYKKQNKDKVVLLFGNHDYHYINPDERYSGYQPLYSLAFKEVLEANFKLFQICYLIPNTNIICSHAGISKVWCANNSIDSNILPINLQNDINELFEFKPNSFKFRGLDPYGDSPESSPIWIREYSLRHNKIKGYRQVVGHTTKNNLRQMSIFVNQKEGYKIMDKNVWMIDTLGTSKEYLVIEDEVIIVKQLKIKEL